MTSNPSTIPIHEPVGNDTNNWTTLSNKEAKIRAKAAEKGHVPHDWRWAFNKVFKTNKAYPKSVRPAVEASNNVPSGNENAAHAPGPSRVQHTTDAPPASDQFDRRQDGMNQSDRHQEGGQFDADHSPTARSRNVADAPLGSNLLGRQQLDGPITAPENAPEMAGGRDRASEPKIQTNIVA